MNKLSFLAESTSLVVKELSDLEFSFQSVAKIQKTTNKSTLTCCRHSPTGSSSWLIFWWRKFGFQTVSNWVPKICCENTFSVFIFTSFYFILKRTWVEQNLILFMYSQIKNLNPYFLSFIHHFSKSSHTLLFLSNVLFASCDPAGTFCCCGQHAIRRVFVNATNISTNIETAVLSRMRWVGWLS